MFNLPYDAKFYTSRTPNGGSYLKEWVFALEVEDKIPFVMLPADQPPELQKFQMMMLLMLALNFGLFAALSALEYKFNSVSNLIVFLLKRLAESVQSHELPALPSLSTITYRHTEASLQYQLALVQGAGRDR